MQKFLRCAAVLLVLATAASAAVAGQSRLSLTLNNGRATLIAQDVPLREILDEWARVGKTTIVNGDKLTAPPVTLQLVDRPEAEVLELLLRSASGYIAAPRDAATPGPSMFARVMILPVSRGPVGATASTQPSPFAARPAASVQPMPMPIADDDDEPAPNVFNANGQPVPQGMQPPTPGMNPGVVGTPNGQLPPGMGGPGQPVLTAPRPGMLPAPPAGQPNPYGAPVPPPVVRPGPGGPGGPGGLEPNDDDYPARAGRGF